MNPSSPYYYDELIIRSLAGEASAADQQELDQWRMADPSHEKQYLNSKKLWEESQAIQAVSTVDTDAAWNRFQRRLQQPQKTAFNWRVAAMVLLIAGAAWSAWWYRSYSAVQQIATTDSIARQVLPDGSAITLNKTSGITWSRKQKRQVTLHGEAFFNITRDTSLPFVVTAGKLTITVLGTSFNVRQTEDSTEVIVTTGKVKVDNGNSSTILLPGDKIIAYDSAATMQKGTESDRLYLYYQQQQFSCDNTPLWKLTEALEKAYNRQITIANPAIRDLRLNAVFQQEPLDRILAIVAQTLSIKVIKVEDNYVLE